MLRMEGTMGLRLESKQSTQLVNNCTFAHQLDFCLTIVLLLAALDLPHFMPSSCKSTWGAPRIRLGVLPPGGQAISRVAPWLRGH
jgi:hypothetical protein